MKTIDKKVQFHSFFQTFCLCLGTLLFIAMGSLGLCTQALAEKKARTEKAESTQEVFVEREKHRSVLDAYGTLRVAQNGFGWWVGNGFPAIGKNNLVATLEQPEIKYQEVLPVWVKVRNLQTGALKYFPLVYPHEIPFVDYLDETDEQVRERGYSKAQRNIRARIKRVNRYLRGFKKIDRELARDLNEPVHRAYAIPGIYLNDKNEKLFRQSIQPQRFPQKKLEVFFSEPQKSIFDESIFHVRRNKEHLAIPIYMRPWTGQYDNSTCSLIMTLDHGYNVDGWMLFRVDFHQMSPYYCSTPSPIMLSVSTHPDKPMDWVAADWRKAVHSMTKKERDLPPLLLTEELIASWRIEGASTKEISIELAAAGNQLLEQGKHAQGLWVLDHAEKLFNYKDQEDEEK